MFIYNITVKIENSIVEEWIQWQKEIHIPEVMGTGFFYDHRFYELLEQDESEGRTFVVQFFARERNDYEKYIENHAPEFRNKTMEKWGSRFIAFRSLLQVVK